MKRIGFIHQGATENGLRRYGELISKAVSQLPGIEVHAASLENPDPSLDLIHLQLAYRDGSIWGIFEEQCRLVQALKKKLPRVPLVATLHDIYTQKRSFGRYRSEALLRRGLSQIYVSSGVEKHRMSRFLRPKTLIIPHFVETREQLLDRATAKVNLGLNNRRVVTLLGFIHPRKGYTELVKTLRYLPSDMILVFAGCESKTSPQYLKSVLSECTAAEQARIHVTGYLNENELNEYLAATDLAVCPFLNMSASGSLSTWIAANRPILASPIEGLVEYNHIEPEALQFAPSLEPKPLAWAIESSLAAAPQDKNLKALSRLRDHLSMARCAQTYIEHYQKLLNHHNPPLLPSLGPNF